MSANPQPASKPLLIIADVVVGGALASPKGFGNFRPQISTLRSTSSTGVKNRGRPGLSGSELPLRDC